MFHLMLKLIILILSTLMSVLMAMGVSVLKGLQHGTALLHLLMSSNEQKSDYMLISVGAQSYPQNPVLQQGSHLNFKSNDHVFGEWLTSNESVISVDTLSGKSEAIGEGIAQVVFKNSNFKLQTTVTVQNSGFIVVDAPKENLTNVPYPAKGYSFSVKFRNAHHDKFGAHRDGVEVLHDCFADPSFLVSTLPWKDLDTGKLYCLFFPYHPEHLARSVTKLKNRKKETYVTMKASLRGADQISGSASAPFIGGFSILDMDKKPMQINLTGDYFIHNLTILGNTGVEVRWKKQDKLTVKLIRREDFQSGGWAKYEFKVHDARIRSYLYPPSGTDFEDTVIFTQPATGQREEIDFQFTVYYPSSWYLKQYFAMCSYAAVMCVCFNCLLDCMGCVNWWKDKFPQTPPAATTTPRALTHGMHTPVSGNTESGQGRYRRTPSPFVEYLMRTIDETPNYYRGETRRRRAHPQNSL